MKISEILLEQQKPSIGYHVTRSINVPSIQKNGINPDSRGNTYIWDTIEMAEWFKDFQNDNDEDRTIIKLDISGLPMTIDNEATDMSEWSSHFQPGQQGGAWIVKGKIPADRIIGLSESQLIENAPRTLYHGTLKSNLPSIVKHGLQPKVGNFTKHFYNDDPDLEELVFASSKKDIHKGLNSIIHLLKQNNISPTPENIIKYGAMVVVKDEWEEFEHRPHNDMNYYSNHPTQVEPGDFYSREPVKVTYILQNKKLRDLLRREGFDAWMGKYHPKLKQEAKYDYPLQDFIDTPYDPGQEWQEEVHNQIRQATNEPTRHRGPQEGKYLNLMLKGIKPVSVVQKEDPSQADIFWPYVKAGKIVLVDEDENDYYFSLPGEEWRARKVKKLFAELDAMWANDDFSIEKEKLLHAKIGRLLGIPKESVRYFINH